MFDTRASLRTKFPKAFGSASQIFFLEVPTTVYAHKYQVSGLFVLIVVLCSLSIHMKTVHWAATWQLPGVHTLKDLGQYLRPPPSLTLLTNETVILFFSSTLKNLELSSVLTSAPSFSRLLFRNRHCLQIHTSTFAIQVFLLQLLFQTLTSKTSASWTRQSTSFRAPCSSWWPCALQSSTQRSSLSASTVDLYIGWLTSSRPLRDLTRISRF